MNVAFGARFSGELISVPKIKCGDDFDFSSTDRSRGADQQGVGVACGAGAGALWGLVFLAPELVRDFSPLQLSIGRYLCYGALAVLLLAPLACSGVPSVALALDEPGLARAGRQYRLLHPPCQRSQMGALR